MKATRDEQLRQGLEARRREIEESIRERLASVREDRASLDHVQPQEDGEVPDIDIQEDIELALVQMKRETLERIDAAIGRWDQGLYGRCAECGQDIQAARLRALPFAVRCLDCEEARETESFVFPSSARPRLSR
jgi:DnaK suppressor protein